MSRCRRRLLEPSGVSSTSSVLRWSEPGAGGDRRDHGRDNEPTTNSGAWGVVAAGAPIRTRARLTHRVDGGTRLLDLQATGRATVVSGQCEWSTAAFPFMLMRAQGPNHTPVWELNVRNRKTPRILAWTVRVPVKIADQLVQSYLSSILHCILASIPPRGNGKPNG